MNPADVLSSQHFRSPFDGFAAQPSAGAKGHDATINSDGNMTGLEASHLDALLQSIARNGDLDPSALSVPFLPDPSVLQAGTVSDAGGPYALAGFPANAVFTGAAAARHFHLAGSDALQRAGFDAECSSGGTHDPVPSSSMANGGVATRAGGTRARGRSRKTEEERQLAVQEKNRRAQQRFRERQKEKMRSMATGVDHLTDQVNELAVANDKLMTHNAVLEKVLALRDETITHYQDRLKVFDTRPSEPAVQQAYGVAAGAKMLPCGGSVDILSGIDAATVSAFKTRSYPELVNEWRGYVQQLANLLVEYEHATDAQRDELTEKVARVVGQTGQLCMMTALFSPIHIKQLLAHNVPEHEQQLQAMSDPVKFWSPLLESLQMTAAQEKELIRLRAIFLSRSSQLLEERRSLAAGLVNATATDVGGGGLRALVRDELRCHEASEKLSRNLQDLHNAEVELNATMFKKVMLPMQLARILVHSYPVYPDALALIGCIAWHKEGGGNAKRHALTAA